jgi:hypothetical protein
MSNDLQPREKTHNSIMGGVDDLWALAGMKKFSILDVSEDASKQLEPALPSDVAASVALEFKPADGAHVHVSISVTAIE